FGPLEQGSHVVRRVARAFKEQAVAVLEREPLQIHAWCLGEMRCAQQLPILAVGPPMHGAYDVAAGVAQVAAGSIRAGDMTGLAAQHDRLSVAAYVRQQFDTIGVANQDATRPLLRQGAPVTYVGYELFVPNIKCRLLENMRLLLGKDRVVEVAVDWKLSLGRRDMRFPTDVGHGSPRDDETRRSV